MNELYPVGRLYCEFCQNKYERKLIEILKKSIENDLDIYDYLKTIAKWKNRKRKNKHTIDRFKVVADKDIRKMSNIIENLIRRYVESRV